MSFYTIDSLTFSYTKESKLINSISFEINETQHLGIIGPNGCGKTTLIRLMLGILKPHSGDICLEGKNIKDMVLSEIGEKVGYIYQNPDKQLFCPSVWEQMYFSFRNKTNLEENYIKEKIRYYLEAFDLYSQKDNSPFELSRGEKQRLAIASVLSRNVQFLILDEPTTSLDILRVKQLEKYLMKLREEKKGYLIISHDEKFIAKHVDGLLSFKDEGVEFN